MGIELLGGGYDGRLFDENTVSCMHWVLGHWVLEGGGTVCG